MAKRLVRAESVTSAPGRISSPRDGPCPQVIAPVALSRRRRGRLPSPSCRWRHVVLAVPLVGRGTRSCPPYRPFQAVLANVLVAPLVRFHPKHPPLPGLPTRKEAHGRVRSRLRAPLPIPCPLTTRVLPVQWQSPRVLGVVCSVQRSVLRWPILPGW